MMLDRLTGQEQACGDPGVGETFAEEGQDILLTFVSRPTFFGPVLAALTPSSRNRAAALSASRSAPRSSKTVSAARASAPATSRFTFPSTCAISSRVWAAR